MLLNPDPGAELPGKHLIPFPLAGRTANEPCSPSPAALLLLPAEVLWLHGCRGTLRIKGSVLGFVVWFGLGFFCLLFFAFCFLPSVLSCFWCVMEITCCARSCSVCSRCNQTDDTNVPKKPRGTRRGDLAQHPHPAGCGRRLGVWAGREAGRPGSGRAEAGCFGVGSRARLVGGGCRRLPRLCSLGDDVFMAVPSLPTCSRRMRSRFDTL